VSTILEVVVSTETAATPVASEFVVPSSESVHSSEVIPTTASYALVELSISTSLESASTSSEVISTSLESSSASSEVVSSS